MPRGRPRTKNLTTRGRPSSKMTVQRKPIRPLERQRMRPWLIELLDSNSCSQLVWACKDENMFRVAWKHAAGQTFDAKADATLFELWATHTGKYYSGDKPDPKRWKANFRCALNSLQDVEEDKSQGVRKGNNAFKVYRFLDEKKPKKNTPKKSKESDDDEVEDEIAALRNIGTKSRPKITSKPFYDSEGSEGMNSPASEISHSDWEERTTNDDIACHEQEMVCDTNEKSPLPDFDQLWQTASIFYKRSCQKERLSESHYPERQPEAFSPQRSAEYSYIPHDIVENDEEASNSVTSHSEIEIGDTIQEYMFGSNDDLFEFFDQDTVIIHEAPEQVIGIDYNYASQEDSPNVIVLAQEGLCDYNDYTSMAYL